MFIFEDLGKRLYHTLGNIFQLLNNPRSFLSDTKFFNVGCNFELEPLITLLEKIKTYPNKYSLGSSLWGKVLSRSRRRLVFLYAFPQKKRFL